MSKHTPTPWKEGTRGPNNCPVIGNEQGLMVCMVNTGVNFQNEADANAAHIVLCVNSHDALVKALEAYQKAYAMPTYGDASDFAWPKITMRVPGEHAWGYECEKHGLGYSSGCICCRDDFNRHAKNKDQQECNKRDDALREASRLAKTALAAAGAPQ